MNADGPGRSQSEGDLRSKTAALLARQEAAEPPAGIARLADYIDRSVRYQRWWERLLARPERLASMDIVRWIAVARDAGDYDEALWRGFLAGHFGRPSAQPENQAQIESAGRLLCGFGGEPYWTWERVSSDLDALHAWLRQQATALATLRFANHRKYESHRPDAHYAVVEGFVAWVQAHGGSPGEAFARSEALTPEERWHRLYPQLTALRRFGRTGAFDLLLFLGQMKVVSVAPDACHLVGATGPRDGARRLWGAARPTQELEQLAVDLARHLDVSPDIIEDALCNWNKKPKPAGRPQPIHLVDG